MKKKIKILLFVMISMITSFAVPKTYAQISVGIGVSVHIAPPALPVYVQPPCPVEGYIWSPGYWAWGPNGYYWVPGVWVMPPQVGFLWTPAYWGFEGGVYGFHAGYWGPHIGFYGGINYGFGYGGVGYVGGMWEGGRFRYNTAITNVNTTIVHNTYINRTVINNVTVNNRTSFNGPGGVQAKPRPEEITAMREKHVSATREQTVHQQTAGKDRNQYASVNHGKPATAAMDKPNGKRFTPQGHVATNNAARLNTENRKTASPASKPANAPVKRNVSKQPTTNNKVTAPKPQTQQKTQPKRTTQPKPQQPAPKKEPTPKPAEPTPPTGKK